MMGHNRNTFGVFMEETEIQQPNSDFHERFRQIYVTLRASVFMSLEKIRGQFQFWDATEIDKQLQIEHQLVQEEINNSQRQIYQLFQKEKQQLQQETLQLRQQVNEMQYQHQQQLRKSDFLWSGFVCAFAFVGIALYFEITNKNYKIAGLCIAALSIFWLLAKKANPNITYLLNKFLFFVNKHESERYPENSALASQVIVTEDTDIKIDINSQPNKLTNL